MNLEIQIKDLLEFKKPTIESVLKPKFDMNSCLFLFECGKIGYIILARGAPIINYYGQIENPLKKTSIIIQIGMNSYLKPLRNVENSYTISKARAPGLKVAEPGHIS